MNFRKIPTEWEGVSLTGLSAKQKRFCEEYAICNNGFESARNSGYNEKYSSDLLKREDIQAYIDFLNFEGRTSRIASKDEVLERLTAVARGESTEEVVINSGSKVLKGTDVRDRVKAMELLGKRYALFTDKIEANGEFSFVIDIPEEEEEEI